MVWYPQDTWLILSLTSTNLGINTFRFPGKWPRTPLRFLPQVNSFPSLVIPAESDFLVSMSIKLMFFMSWGRLVFDSEPVPSSPFLPKPQVQACPSLRGAVRKELGRKKAAASASPMTFVLLIMFNYGSEFQKHPDRESNPDSRI